MFKGLREEYKEKPFAIGLTSDSFVVMMWSSSEGNFSITITSEARNISCLVVDGKSLKILNEVKRGQPTRLHTSL